MLKVYRSEGGLSGNYAGTASAQTGDIRQPVGQTVRASNGRNAVPNSCDRLFTAHLKLFMALLLQRASLASVAAGFLAFFCSITGSGAAAQDSVQNKAPSPAQLQPSLSVFDEKTADDTLTPAQPEAASLADLVAAEQEAAGSETSDDIQCLAGAIYFEAGNEPLDGQLAVGRVIVNRTRSGRFPTSYCGVVYQRSQFSFVHGHQMPAIKTQSRKWQNALAIAHIAHENRWKSSAEGALFFHAARLGARWQTKVRVAQIENHIFYR